MFFPKYVNISPYVFMSTKIHIKTAFLLEMHYKYLDIHWESEEQMD
jgi:hypothetical protein